MGSNNRKKGIAADSLKLSIAQTVSLLINMIIVMLLSRFRSVEEYGTYSQMLMVSSIVVTFFASGFAQCINYFLAGESNTINKSNFIKTYYGIIGICGLIGGIVSVLLIPILTSYFGNEKLKDYWFFLLIYPVSKIVNDGVDRFFILYKKTNQLMLYKIRYGVTTLITVLAAIVLKWEFRSYLLVLVLTELLFGILVYWFVYKITGIIPFGFNAVTAKNIMSFAIPMALASLVSVINKELDKLVVGGLTDTATLAVFTNAAKELPITVFSASIVTVVMPHVVRQMQNGETREAISIWKESIKLTAMIMCFFCVSLLVFAPQVISVLYSDKYLSGVNVFRIYLLTELFRLTYYGMILNAEKKTQLILYSSIGSMIVNLILDIILYRLIGIEGPAWATVASVVAMNMFQLIYTKNHIDVSFFDIYPVAYILKCIALNIILSFPFAYLQNILFKYVSFNKNIMTIVLGVVWLVVYLFIIRKRAKRLWKTLNA